MNEPMQQVGRLVMRKEGGNWNAYYVLPDSMEDAIFIGSICMGAIVDNTERKQRFVEMMCDIVSDFIEANTGVRPLWYGPYAAPKHERVG